MRLDNVPVIRSALRYYREITRDAPLDDFRDYDDYWRSRVRDGRQAKFLDRYRIVSSKLSKNSKVLDVGCGDGAFLQYLMRNRPDCEMVGADISKVAVDQLKKHGIPAKLIEPSRPLDQQLDQDWDAVVLMEVIEHIIDSEALIEEVINLRPKKIFITIPNAGFMVHRLRLMFGGRFPITSIAYHMKEHIRFWTVKDFFQWANANGLKVISYHGQIDRPDWIVRKLGRVMPGLFANRMVYEVGVDGSKDNVG